MRAGAAGSGTGPGAPGAWRPRRRRSVSEIVDAVLPESSTLNPTTGGPLTWVKRLDRFGYEPRQEAPRFRSWVGLIATLAIAVVTFSYIVATTNQFANGLPVRVAVRTDPDLSAVDAPVPYILFRANGLEFYNESVFKITFTEYVIRDRDALPRVARPLGTSFCPWPGGVGLALCPRNDPYTGPAVAGVEFTTLPRLEGTFEQPLYRFLEIAVRLCCTAENVCAPECEQWNTSLAKLHSFGADFVMIPRGSTSSQLTERATFNSFSYQSTDFFFVKTFSRERARWLFDAGTLDQTLHLDSRTLYQQNPR